MTLKISYDELRREAGRFLGYDRDPDEWDSTQELDVGDILRSGLRLFYWPNVGETRYAWSFLRKQETVTTVSGTSAYELAADFEGMLSGFSYQTGSARRRVARVPEEEVASLQGKNNLSGAPEYCALRVVQPADDVNQTHCEALFYPTPDAAYTLTYRYSVSPPELSETIEYHLGGAVHSECVLEACLAAAEKTMQPEHGPGIHAERFQQLLQASVKIDAEMQ